MYIVHNYVNVRTKIPALEGSHFTTIINILFEHIFVGPFNVYLSKSVWPQTVSSSSFLPKIFWKKVPEFEKGNISHNFEKKEKLKFSTWLWISAPLCIY